MTRGRCWSRCRYATTGTAFGPERAARLADAPWVGRGLHQRCRPGAVASAGEAQGGLVCRLTVWSSCGFAELCGVGLRGVTRRPCTWGVSSWGGRV